MTEEQLELLVSLLQYRDRYQINIQFWPDQTAVYIQKDGIDLIDYGGGFDFAIRSALEYMERINKVKK